MHYFDIAPLAEVHKWRAQAVVSLALMHVVALLPWEQACCSR
jgi:hypothetical protein